MPKHRAPDVVIASGMTEDGYVPVDSATLQSRFPRVYAIGDVATAGVPKAGVFAEGAARVVAQTLMAEEGLPSAVRCTRRARTQRQERTADGVPARGLTSLATMPSWESAKSHGEFDAGRLEGATHPPIE